MYRIHRRRKRCLPKFNDNHEPAGTAGIPILEAIRKAGLSDTVVCGQYDTLVELNLEPVV